MDRKEFWYGQLVEDDALAAGLNIVFDQVEASLDHLATDYSTDGVLGGLVVTQHGIPDMTVDVSAGVAYDHEGKRCRVALAQNVDLGGIALPGVGNEKWVSLRIDYQQTDADPWVDDFGAPGFWTHNESYQFTLTEGLEALIGAALRPALHASEVLLADIHLLNGMVQIVNADIFTNRREDTRWPATMIFIDGTLKPWTELDVTKKVLSDVIDDIDTKLIDVTVAGLIEQGLVPDGNGTRDLGSATATWNVYAKLIEASANGDQFGTAAKRFDCHIESSIHYNHIEAAAEKNIGTDGNPFATAACRTFRSGIAHGAGIGGFTYAVAKIWTKVVPLEWGRRDNYDGIDPANQWQYHDSNNYDPDAGGPNPSVTSCMWYISNNAGHTVCVPVILPDGAIITGCELHWAQTANAAGDMRAILQKYQETGIVDIANVTIGVFGVWRNDNMGAIAETVDTTKYAYRIKIESPTDAGAVEAAVARITISGTIADIGRATGW